MMIVMKVVMMTSLPTADCRHFIC